ncbi:MAG TPA: winged helix-turn-helix domain-containing protein, partial [Candidatus Nitrosotalea sp.]|nr:winged helix-turn-helix domain-containing protein [Candidatus Nitrosotalea sp.]
KMYHKMYIKMQHALQNTRKNHDPIIPLSDFKPNLLVLLRIMRILFEKNRIGKTSLSLEANVNYTGLLRYLQWLHDKHLIEFVIEVNGISVVLSQLGREFASSLSILY